MARVVIFGLRDMASLAHFYLTHDSGHEVVGFAADPEFVPAEQRFEGKPVVSFEEVDGRFPPSEHRFFAPLSERRMNLRRAGVYQRIKARGYTLISYVSSKATVFPGARIGENCFILEDNTIQPFTPIGDDVVMWSGNHIGHHGSIGDHAFFSSHVVLSGHCNVGAHCFFGVNATVKDGLDIAEGTLVGMSASLTRNTEPWSVYTGSPAKRRRLRSTDVDL